MTEFAAVFIDVGYLNSILRHFGEPKINFEKLSNYMTEVSGVAKHRTYFYDCLPVVRKGNTEDQLKLSKRQSFHTLLQRLPRTELRLGRLQVIDNKFQQKKVDVLLSLDIVTLCADKHIKHVLLLAGDSDFVPAIQLAKRYGGIIHLFYLPQSVHTEMLDETDEFHPITKEFLELIQ